jgi:hypothetical protein
VRQMLSKIALNAKTIGTESSVQKILFVYEDVLSRTGVSYFVPTPVKRERIFGRILKASLN